MENLRKYQWKWIKWEKEATRSKRKWNKSWTNHWSNGNKYHLKCLQFIGKQSTKQNKAKISLKQYVACFSFFYINGNSKMMNFMSKNETIWGRVMQNLNCGNSMLVIVVNWNHRKWYFLDIFVWFNYHGIKQRMKWKACRFCG